MIGTISGKGRQAKPLIAKARRSEIYKIAPSGPSDILLKISFARELWPHVPCFSAMQDREQTLPITWQSRAHVQGGATDLSLNRQLHRSTRKCATQ